MDIQVFRKNIYGKERFYPVTKDAIFLANLIGCPSLAMRHLKLCKQHGWDVSFVTEKIDFDDYIEKEK
jgi:hypothetical protein